MATTMPAAPPAATDDLALPLSDVTFVVVDLETTGCVPGEDRIIEVAAARFRGGECLGTFQTLVDPQRGVPPWIVVLTGITEQMLAPAPTIEQVLPSFLEFVGDAVLVGHNLRFDTSFLDAALVASGRARLGQRRVDTLRLARALVRDEVENCRLATLAAFFRTTTAPTHRALDDVLATVDVLHGLFERAAGFGVFALDDLLSMPVRSEALLKLPLALALPRRPGVYLFRAADGRVVYIGRADDLRARVRSLFTTDSRRRLPRLLRETAHVDHVVCATTLEAAVLELRLIEHYRPRRNRTAGRWRSYGYVRVDRRAGRESVSVTRKVKADRRVYLGPLAAADARRIVAAWRQGSAEGSDSYTGMLQRQARIDLMRAAGRLVLDHAGHRLVLDGGRLVEPALALPPAVVTASPPGVPLRREEVDEVLVTSRWLTREAARGRLRVEHVSGVLASPWRAPPQPSPATASTSRARAKSMAVMPPSLCVDIRTTTRL